MKDEKRIYGSVQPYMYRKAPFTIEAPGYEKKKGETIPRRNRHAKDALILTPSAEVSTIYENFRRAAAKYGNAKCIGHRRIIKIHTENKKVKKLVDGKEQEVEKKWTYWEMSGYEYITFNEYEQMALNAASGLRHLGLKKDDKMHLYGATRYVGCRTDARAILTYAQWKLAVYVARCFSSIHSCCYSLRLARRGGSSTFTQADRLPCHLP